MSGTRGQDRILGSAIVIGGFLAVPGRDRLGSRPYQSPMALSHPPGLLGKTRNSRCPASATIASTSVFRDHDRAATIRAEMYMQAALTDTVSTEPWNATMTAAQIRNANEAMANSGESDEDHEVDIKGLMAEDMANPRTPGSQHSIAAMAIFLTVRSRSANVVALDRD